MIRKRPVYIIFFILLGVCASAQSLVQGTVLDKSGNSLMGINVMVFMPDSPALIAYAITDKAGVFSIPLKHQHDSLIVEFSAINYKSVRRKIIGITNNFIIRLDEDVKQLEAFEVKATPITRYGDTISYLVNAFARQQDRSIEDVLGRMPGIEIRESGQILYQGLPLEKFYVEGLDLMGGRYAMVSKNLPYRSVSTVEILENHQPKKVLQKMSVTPYASINIKLKKDVTITGNAKLGLGVAPFLYDAKIVPMIFSRKLQSVVSCQTNNVGNDLASQLNKLDLENTLNEAYMLKNKGHALGIGGIITPDIPQEKWLGNNANLLNTNVLTKFGDELQLRSNIYYLNDWQDAHSVVRHSIYSPADTIRYQEETESQSAYSRLLGEFTLTRNVKSGYFKNKTSVETRWDDKKGHLLQDGVPLEQKLDLPMLSLENDLQGVFSLGEKLLDVKSYLYYSETDQSLKVTPGSFDKILNDSMPYPANRQDYDMQQFFTQNSLSLKLAKGRFFIKPELGFNLHQLALQTNLLKQITDGSWQDAGADFRNNQKGNQLKLFASISLEYKARKFEFKLGLPLNQYFIEQDEIKGKGQEISALLLDPFAYAQYKLHYFWKIKANFFYRQSYSDIDQVYPSFIMTSYNSLIKRDIPLDLHKSLMAGCRIEYRNSMISFFNHLSYTFVRKQSGYIYNAEIDADGRMLYKAFALPNTTFVHSLSGRTSKYLQKLKMSLAFGGGLSFSTSTTYLNGQLMETDNFLFSLKPEVRLDVLRWLNCEYELDARVMEFSSGQEQKEKLNVYQHHLGLIAFLNDHQTVNFSTDYYRHDEEERFFMDLSYKYSIPSKNIDLELKCSNILNSFSYISYYISQTSVRESEYFIRPRQIVLYVNFSF